MFWNRLRAHRPAALASLYCRTHELWLNRMIAAPSDAAAPRIPVRRVTDGGFSHMMRNPHGRARADRWWEAALSRVELSDAESAP